MRIKNLKYDPKHADKPMRGYSHLEYLDRVFTIEQARKTIAYEKKMGYPPTMEILDKKNKVKKTKKTEAPDLELTKSKEDLNEADS